MVYCTKCGVKNEEAAAVCVKCGASLVTRPAWRRERRRHEKGEKQEQECFGLPHGGAIAGLVFGIIIIFAGIIFVLQQTGVIAEDWDLIWPFVVIVFGVLVLAGALYGLGRRS